MSDNKMDADLKKAFLDLQQTMKENNRRVASINATIEAQSEELRLASITRHAVARLPPQTNTYEAVGRMFIRSDVNVLKKKYNTAETHLKNRIQESKNMKLYLDRNLQESKEHVRELVQQRKQKILDGIQLPAEAADDS